MKKSRFDVRAMALLDQLGDQDIWSQWLCDSITLAVMSRCSSDLRDEPAQRIPYEVLRDFGHAFMATEVVRYMVAERGPLTDLICWTGPAVAKVTAEVMAAPSLLAYLQRYIADHPLPAEFDNAAGVSQ